MIPHQLAHFDVIRTMPQCRQYRRVLIETLKIMETWVSVKSLGNGDIAEWPYLFFIGAPPPPSRRVSVSNSSCGPACLRGGRSGRRYICVVVQVGLDVRRGNPDRPTADARRAEFAVGDQFSDG